MKTSRIEELEKEYSYIWLNEKIDWYVLCDKNGQSCLPVYKNGDVALVIEVDSEAEYVVSRMIEEGIEIRNGVSNN